ncbi:MAG: hypothetical protein ACRCXT_01700 [Paraclostridium sp.]
MKAHSVLFSQLTKLASSISRNELRALSGLMDEPFTKLYSEMHREKLLKLDDRGNTLPTERFRNAYREALSNGVTTKPKAN